MKNSKQHQLNQESVKEPWVIAGLKRVFCGLSMLNAVIIRFVASSPVIIGRSHLIKFFISVDQGITRILLRLSGTSLAEIKRKALEIQADVNRSQPLLSQEEIEQQIAQLQQEKSSNLSISGEPLDTPYFEFSSLMVPTWRISRHQKSGICGLTQYFILSPRDQTSLFHGYFAEIYPIQSLEEFKRSSGGTYSQWVERWNCHLYRILTTPISHQFVCSASHTVDELHEAIAFLEERILGLFNDHLSSDNKEPKEPVNSDEDKDREVT